MSNTILSPGIIRDWNYQNLETQILCLYCTVRRWVGGACSARAGVSELGESVLQLGTQVSGERTPRSWWLAYLGGDKSASVSTGKTMKWFAGKQANKMVLQEERNHFWSVIQGFCHGRIYIRKCCLFFLQQPLFSEPYGKPLAKQSSALAFQSQVKKGEFGAWHSDLTTGRGVFWFCPHRHQRYKPNTRICRSSYHRLL